MVGRAVLFAVLLSWMWGNSAMASEPMKPASLISGELLSKQVSKQAGDVVDAGGNGESETHRMVRGRIIGLAIVFSGLLLLLGLSFVYLRLDHATRGFHSGRLQLLAAFLGLLIVGICFFFLNQIVLMRP